MPDILIVTYKRNLPKKVMRLNEIDKCKKNNMLLTWYLYKETESILN